MWVFGGGLVDCFFVYLFSRCVFLFFRYLGGGGGGFGRGGYFWGFLPGSPTSSVRLLMFCFQPDKVLLLHISLLLLTADVMCFQRLQSKNGKPVHSFGIKTFLSFFF